MKNVIFKGVIFVSFFLLSFGKAEAFVCPDGELTAEEILVRNATMPIDPDVERSLIPAVEAYLFRAAHEIEVYINKDLGPVTVQIVNAMGIPVNAVTFDSYIQPAITLQAPTTAGSYTLYIMGISYQGTGTFNIN